MGVVFWIMVLAAGASVVYLAWPQPKPAPPEEHEWTSGPTNDYQVFG